jgi:hypothetical protein
LLYQMQLVPLQCGACTGTGIENNWLYGPADGGGWGPRGEWRDVDKPPPMPPPPPPPP